MENTEILKDIKSKNNRGEANYDIFDNFAKNIDVQKLIDDGILKIGDEVREYIDSLGYSIEDVLRLAGMYKQFENLESIEFKLSIHGSFYISIYGDKYLISRKIFHKEGIIKNKHIHTDKSNISGFKSFIEEVCFAKQKGYKKIKCYAAGGAGSPAEIGQVGYYYWPMLGFNFDKKNSNYSYLQSILDIVNKKGLINCEILDNLFDLKDKNGNLIGIEFWKKYGQSFFGEFDLTDGSKSIKRLNEYIISKKQSNPEKYNDIDVIK